MSVVFNLMRSIPSIPHIGVTTGSSDVDDNDHSLDGSDSADEPADITSVELGDVDIDFVDDVDMSVG